MEKYWAIGNRYVLSDYNREPKIGSRKMNLQQLRYLVAIVDHGLNISEAAEVLFTSQPGISKQIRQLEDELGVSIFVRRGKRFIGLTEPGRLVVERARRLVIEAAGLKRIGDEHRAHDEGTLTIATTHTQARYVLPPAIKQFTARFPKVRLLLHQGNPVQVAQFVAKADADLGIATESLADNPELVTLPCYEWNRCVIMPRDHPLAQEKTLTIEALALHPIVTYDYSFTGASAITAAFGAKGLTPNIALTALDADVIKTYVELGLGVGIIAQMAYEAERDQQFAMLPAGHLFQPSLTRLALRRGAYLRSYTYDFIGLFAPHLSHATIDAALAGTGAQA
ncbi:MAG: CysB family HTH-type transcriptional regulator [Betaproteobacteria bacterium]